MIFSSLNLLLFICSTLYLEAELQFWHVHFFGIRSSEHEPVKVDTAEWTEYTIIARGNHLIHQVNGETTSELFDYHEEGRALEGLIAIQLHRGNPNRVEIKEIEMRELKDGNILPFELPEGAEKIDRPRTSNPQGTGPIQKGKKG